MKLPLVVLLSTLASVTYGAGLDSAAWDQFNTRMHEMFDTTGWEFRQAVDTKQITKDLQSNQARAQIKYSRPGIYHGRISKIMKDDQGAFFIMIKGKILL